MEKGMSEQVSVFAHVYTVAVLIPTAVANLLLIYLICRQRWRSRQMEGIIIFLVALLDVVYSVSMLMRYAISAGGDAPTQAHKLNSAIKSGCDWSGCLLAITMHGSTALLAILSFVRYDSIVNQALRPIWFWVILVIIPLTTISALSIFSSLKDLYVLMPGGLSCHVWSSTRDDELRTPIQIFFSYNILISLLIMIFCYWQIAKQQHRALESMSETPSRYDSAEMGEAQPPEVKKNQLQNQQQTVQRRIFFIILIYTLCLLPECALEQMEVVLGIPRPPIADAICTHFRTLYALANALVVMSLHSHTRNELKALLFQLRSRFPFY